MIRIVLRRSVIILSALIVLTPSAQAFAQSAQDKIYTPAINEKQNILFLSQDYCSANGQTQAGSSNSLDKTKVPEPLYSYFIKAGEKYNVYPSALAGLYLTEQNGFDNFSHKYETSKNLDVFSALTPTSPEWKLSKFETGTLKNGPWGESAGAGTRSFAGPFQFGQSEWQKYGEDGSGDGQKNVDDFYDEVFAAAHYIADLGGTTNKGIEGVRTAARNYNGENTIETDGRKRQFMYGDQVAFFTTALGSIDSTSTAVTPGSTGSTKNNTFYKSGLSAPYNVEQFVTHVLKAIAQKTGKPESEVVTQEHIVALVTFATMEGGGVDGHAGNFNLFNTKLHTPDLGAIPRGTEDQSRTGSGLPPTGNTSPATYDYPNFDTGVEATARSMVQSKYQSRLVTALTTKSSTAEGFFETLTYYNRYPGNLAWAAASDPKSGGDPVKYLNGMLSVLKNVRNNYVKLASKALNGSTGAASATGTGGTGNSTNCQSTATTIDVIGDGLFKTNTAIVIPGADEAVARAKRLTDLSGKAFLTACPKNRPQTDKVYCQELCDHLAGEVWGYSSSGYYSAQLHWEAMVASGQAHPGDRNPPVGASLFYASGKNGHIATYLGDGLLLSNDVLDKEKGFLGGAYIVPTGKMEKDGWGLKYYGWAMPVFKGAKRSPAI